VLAVHLVLTLGLELGLQRGHLRLVGEDRIADSSRKLFRNVARSRIFIRIARCARFSARSRYADTMRFSSLTCASAR
jgi:hypothetical protein